MYLKAASHRHWTNLLPNWFFLMVCLHCPTPRPIPRQIKMGCIGLCGGVHTTQRQMTTQTAQTDDHTNAHWALVCPSSRYLCRCRAMWMHLKSMKIFSFNNCFFFVAVAAKRKDRDRDRDRDRERDRDRDRDEDRRDRDDRHDRRDKDLWFTVSVNCFYVLLNKICVFTTNLAVLFSFNFLKDGEHSFSDEHLNI